MNLGQLLVAAAERHPDAEAVVDAEERLTYADLLERARGVAGGLAGLGVKPGERVVGALRNRVETVVLYWACQWLGACFVPVNWRLKPDEIRYCATDADATVFVAEPHVAEQVGARPAAVLPGGDPAPGPSDVRDGDPALMLYTSGTTGRPKGVPRSQRAEWSAALAHVIQCRYRPGERTLGVMPLYHTMAVRSLLAMHAVGGCFVVRSEFNAAEAIEVIASERVSALYLAPTLYHDLVEALAGGARDGLPVPRLAYAGAPMSATLVERCSAAFAPEVFVNHYGSTEIYTFAVHGEQRAKPGCAGRPGLHGRLRLEPLTADPGPEGGGADQDDGNGVGEILAALDSDEAFTGYWKRPDADARAFTPDGWYRTGDLGHLDVDGDLWVVGRADDMVISGGENIHPTEVEDTLVAHPAVIEAAVIGQADPRLGQRVTAFVVTREEIESSVLDAWCRRSALADFKRPREYRFVETLPKSPSGKLLRRLLREDPGP
ncbi:MAG TPA: AMP-binding protein [Acidimicrobiia bacterium]|nr:AMP-binding protein [Acidimicrobiia bacterium]